MITIPDSSESLFVKHFAGMPGPQASQTRDHEPLTILRIAATAVICGASPPTCSGAASRLRWRP